MTGKLCAWSDCFIYRLQTTQTTRYILARVFFILRCKGSSLQMSNGDIRALLKMATRDSIIEALQHAEDEREMLEGRLLRLVVELETLERAREYEETRSLQFSRPGLLFCFCCGL
jgi:hypothetical protein